MRHPPPTVRPGPPMPRGRRIARAGNPAAGLAALLGLVLVLGCAAGDARDSSPHREVIVPPSGILSPVFSPGIRTGNLIFLSGAIGTRPGTTELVEGGIAAETRQTLENLREVLRAAGSGMDDVVKCTVFLADIEEYGPMNEVYAEFFTDDPPARSTVAGSGLAFDARVEIECIAAVAG